MKTIDDIIKQAVAEAGLKPSGNGKERSDVKSANDGSVADRLYLLADELEKMGDVPIGGGEKKARANNSLRQLAKTFIYQQNLKQASDDRMGVEDSADIEKLAAHVEARNAYLDAFEKQAGIILGAGLGAGIGALINKEDRGKGALVGAGTGAGVSVGARLGLLSSLKLPQRPWTGAALGLGGVALGGVTGMKVMRRIIERNREDLKKDKNAPEKQAGLKDVVRAVGNFPKKHPYVSMGIGAALGTRMGQWMGKNVGSYNLANTQMSPAELKELDAYYMSIARAGTRRDYGKLRSLKSRYADVINKHTEKRKAVRSQM